MKTKHVNQIINPIFFSDEKNLLRVKSKLPKIKTNDENKNLCFSFAKGTRTIVYIKKTWVENIISQTHEELDYKSYDEYSESSIKPIQTFQAKCNNDKIRNPATNRCIMLATAEKKNLIKPPVPIFKASKQWPEGKVLNPKTNRCIKVKPVKPVKSVKPAKTVKPNKPVTILPSVPKQCPEGKVLNPKTNRCIKVKPIKPAKTVKSNKLPPVPKQCPEGKILNPKTNRCIKIKISK